MTQSGRSWFKHIYEGRQNEDGTILSDPLGLYLAIRQRDVELAR